MAGQIFYLWLKTQALGLMKIFLPLSILIALLPTPEQMWKIRLAIVKFELASPENVSKGVDAIERIAHALECKYLKCDDKKEDKK